VAHQLGIDEAMAEVLPDQKLEKVRALQAQGRSVAMAVTASSTMPGHLALAQANVGHRHGHRHRTSRSRARALRSSKETLRAISKAIRPLRRRCAMLKQNLFFALRL